MAQNHNENETEWTGLQGLSSVSMFCRKHQKEMIWTTEKTAVCPSCFAHAMDCSLELAISIINKHKEA